MEPILLCQNLTIGYGNKCLVSNINLVLKRGEYLCVVGSNGSGKTTFVRTILGLNKPLEGTYKWLNTKTRAYLPQEKKFQQAFPATVKEIVISGALKEKGLLPFYCSSISKRAIEKMKLVNILEYQNARFSSLSGGQKQRVLLARALMTSSEIIVLDEPITGLDAKMESDLYQLLNDFNKKGATIIMVSHDIKRVITYAHKVLTFKTQQATLLESKGI